MPSPFNNKTEQVKVDATPGIEVTDSTLTCQYCYVDTDNGIYYINSKTLVWSCKGCGQQNIVRDIQL